MSPKINLDDKIFKYLPGGRYVLLFPMTQRLKNKQSKARYQFGVLNPKTSTLVCRTRVPL